MLEAQGVDLTRPVVAVKCPNSMHEEKIPTFTRDKQDTAEGT